MFYNLSLFIYQGFNSSIMWNLITQMLINIVYYHSKIISNQS